MHFDIHLDRTKRENAKVLLDGVDITKYVLADGFGITLNALQQPVLSMRLRPNSVDVDGQLYVTEAPPVWAAETVQCSGCNPSNRDVVPPPPERPAPAPNPVVPDNSPRALLDLCTAEPGCPSGDHDFSCPEAR